MYVNTINNVHYSTSGFVLHTEGPNEREDFGIIVSKQHQIKKPPDDKWTV